jgi:hypothetical protein
MESDSSVQNAVGFLRHPKVQSADPASKVAFLRNKGLSNAQIAKAFEITQPDTGIHTKVLSGEYDRLPPPPSTSSAPLAQVGPVAPQTRVADRSYVWATLGGALVFAVSAVSGFLAKDWWDRNHASEDKQKKRVSDMDQVVVLLQEQINVQKALSSAIKSVLAS